MLADAQWMRLEPLIEACRPKGKTPPQDLRRTITAILWRHENGAKWRAIPADLGPWSRAAQMFIRWAHLGVWERLLLLAQERGVQLGMTFLDGTSGSFDVRFGIFLIPLSGCASGAYACWLQSRRADGFDRHRIVAAAAGGCRSTQTGLAAHSSSSRSAQTSSRSRLGYAGAARRAPGA